MGDKIAASAVGLLVSAACLLVSAVCWSLLSFCWSLLSVCWTLLSVCWSLLLVCWSLLSVCWTLLSVCWTLLSVCWTLLSVCAVGLLGSSYSLMLCPCWQPMSNEERDKVSPLCRWFRLCLTVRLVPCPSVHPVHHYLKFFCPLQALSAVCCLLCSCYYSQDIFKQLHCIWQAL